MVTAQAGGSGIVIIAGCELIKAQYDALEITHVFSALMRSKGEKEESNRLRNVVDLILACEFDWAKEAARAHPLGQSVIRFYEIVIGKDFYKQTELSIEERSKLAAEEIKRNGKLKEKYLELFIDEMKERETITEEEIPVFVDAVEAELGDADQIAAQPIPTADPNNPGGSGGSTICSLFDVRLDAYVVSATLSSFLVVEQQDDEADRLQAAAQKVLTCDVDWDDENIARADPAAKTAITFYEVVVGKGFFDQSELTVAERGQLAASEVQNLPDFKDKYLQQLIEQMQNRETLEDADTEAFKAAVDTALAEGP